MTESTVPPDSRTTPDSHTPGWLIAAFWLFVGVPLAWGVFHTIVQASQLFRHD